LQNIIQAIHVLSINASTVTATSGGQDSKSPPVLRTERRG